MIWSEAYTTHARRIQDSLLRDGGQYFPAYKISILNMKYLFKDIYIPNTILDKSNSDHLELMIKVIRKYSEKEENLTDGDRVCRTYSKM